MKLSHLFLSLLLALIGFAARAEPPSDDQWLEHMKSRLGLSEQQVGEMKKIHDELKPEREALREKHKALHEKMAERVKGVLNEAQQKKFEEMHKRREGRGKGMRGMQGGDMDECPMHEEGAGMEHCRPGHGPEAGKPMKGPASKKPEKS